MVELTPPQIWQLHRLEPPSSRVSSQWSGLAHTTHLWVYATCVRRLWSHSLSPIHALVISHPGCASFMRSGCSYSVARYLIGLSNGLSEIVQCWRYRRCKAAKLDVRNHSCLVRTYPTLRDLALALDTLANTKRYVVLASIILPRCPVGTRAVHTSISR